MKFDGEIIQKINQVINDSVMFFSHFGIIGAVLMAFFESIFPQLPLIAIAAINTKNYGIFGFVFTYTGSVLGTMLVFMFIRKFLTDRFQSSKFLLNHKMVQKFMKWVETKGFTSIMMLMCFPFVPTSFINYACAFSKMPKREFLAAVLISKIVSIAFLSYVGTSLLEFIDKPLNAVIALSVMVIIYFLSKFIEKKVG